LTVVVACHVLLTERAMFELITFCPSSRYLAPSTESRSRWYVIADASALSAIGVKNSTVPLAIRSVALDKARHETVPVHVP
jgi:hypothetical protein